MLQLIHTSVDFLLTCIESIHVRLLQYQRVLFNGKYCISLQSTMHVKWTRTRESIYRFDPYRD